MDQDRPSIDHKALTDALMELNVMRRVIGFYPPSHSLVKNTLQRTMDFLGKMLAAYDEVVLGVVADGFIIEDEPFGTDNSVLSAFANGLRKKGIAALKLRRGIETRELIEFQGLIAMDPFPARDALTKLQEERGLLHIELTPIAVSSFKFVKDELKAVGESTVLDAYVTCLLRGELLDGSAESDEMIRFADPTKVAEAVTEQAENGDDASLDAVCESLVRAYLHSRQGHQQELDNSSLARFRVFVEGLSPELKERFLTKAYADLGKRSEHLESVMSELTREEFLKTAEVFTSSGIKIPDTLQQMVDRLSAEGKPFEFDTFFSGSAVVHDIDIDAADIERIRKDNTGELAGMDYRDQLGRMTEGGYKAAAAATEIAADFQPDAVERSSAWVVREVFDPSSLSSSEYSALLGRIGASLDKAIARGKLTEAYNYYQTVAEYISELSHMELTYQFINDRFRSPRASEQIALAITRGIRRDAGGAAKLMAEIGETLVKPLVALLTHKEYAEDRTPLVKLMRAHRSLLADECANHLGHPDPEVRLSMLTIIAAAGDKGHGRKVRKAAVDEDTRVAAEAVSTLFTLKSDEAPAFLLRLLQSKDEETRDAGIKLSGRHRVRQAVPELIRMASKFDPLGLEIELKTDVVQALGMIGDPSAVETVEKLYRSHSLLKRDEFRKLKQEIIRSLRGYPREDVEGLLENAAGSSDQTIRSLAAQSSRAGKEKR